MNMLEYLIISEKHNYMYGSLRFTWAWMDIAIDDVYRQNILIVRVDLVYAYYIKWYDNIDGK